MSLAARRNVRTRTALVDRVINQEAAEDIACYSDQPPYSKDYFAQYATQPNWKSRRSMVELPFLDCEANLQQEVMEHIGDGCDSPNWDYPDEITIGFAFGATQNNFLIWQGNEYWNINSVIL
jgi:hypothetical protein